MTTAINPGNILQIGLGFWASKTLLTAVELGVFSELARAPSDVATLQGKLKLHPRSARDFLDALVALKLIERNDGIYSNAPDTDFFLDKAKPSYIGGVLEMSNARLYGFWGSLTDALRTGKPQNEIKKGGNLFDAIYAEPERLRVFLESMTGVSAAAAQALAVRFDWSKYRSFADVGTAQGIVPVMVAGAHPHLEGIGFDLPAVGPVFEDFVARHGLNGQVHFEGGNFFERQLPSADVIIMGHVLHDWDMPQKKMLLAKAFEALPKGGALIVYEMLIDDDRRDNAFGLLMSLNMLIETDGGFDFTGADCRNWMHEAGFVSTRAEPLAGLDMMVVGFKP